jgi:DNA-binding SARP family transcriptional activator
MERTEGSDARLELLNGFRLIHDGEPVELPRPAERLVGFLALQDRPSLRSHVATTLWLDSTDARAAGSLRSALWKLRRLGYPLVEAQNRRLRLLPAVAVDHREAVATARQLLDPSSDLERISLDNDLLSGDLLPDWYEDWVVLERERFRELRIHALESLCERLTASGRYGQAVEAGLAALTGEPLRESTHQALIRLHLAEGNRAQAIHQYDLLRGLLRDRLGVEPSSETRRLLTGLVS